MVQALILGSSRHVHMKQEDLEVLFGKHAKLTVKRYLDENFKEGGFLSEQQVTVVGPMGQFKASVLGDLRPYTQVEISYTNARTLGIIPNMSDSGLLHGTAPCKLIGPAGELDLNEGLMIVRRHIHMSEEDMAELGCQLGDMVRLRIPGARALVFEQVKVAKQFKGMHSLVHIDYDEMNAAAINNRSRTYGVVEFYNDVPYLSE